MQVVDAAVTASLAVTALVSGAFALRRARVEAFAGSVSPPTFLAAFVSYGAIALGAAISAVLGLGSLETVPLVVRVMGLGVGVVGLGIYTVARLQLRSFKHTWGLESSSLISTGIYSRSRHPQVVGWAAVLIGPAIWSGSSIAFGFVSLFVVSSAVWLPIEEAALLERFGREYADYRARTPILWLRRR